MSTRAVITVKDDDDVFHIYTHSDGYPSYTAERLTNATAFMFLDRFEAGDFAAAVIAGNAKDKRYIKGKECLSQGGTLHLTTDYAAHGDLEYRYEVTGKQGKLKVVAFKSTHDDTWEQIFTGSLARFQAFTEESADA